MERKEKRNQKKKNENWSEAKRNEKRNEKWNGMIRNENWTEKKQKQKKRNRAKTKQDKTPELDITHSS